MEVRSLIYSFQVSNCKRSYCLIRINLDVQIISFHIRARPKDPDYIISQRCISHSLHLSHLNRCVYSLAPRMNDCHHSTLHCIEAHHAHTSWMPTSHQCHVGPFAKSLSHLTMYFWSIFFQKSDRESTPSVLESTIAQP